MIKALAVLILISFAPMAAGADLVYNAPAPAPEKYTKLQWKFPTNEPKIGYWFSDKQVLAIDKRITYLETKAAEECVNEQIRVKSWRFPGWVWWTTGLVLGGVAGWYSKAWYDRAHPDQVTTQ